MGWASATRLATQGAPILCRLAPAHRRVLASIRSSSSSSRTEHDGSSTAPRRDKQPRCLSDSRRHKATDVTSQLEAFAKRADSDACARILATPLRRCSVTQAVLPKGLMFQVAVQQPASEPSDPSIVAAGLADDLRQTSQDLRRRQKRTRRARWLRREGVRKLDAALARSIRTLKHKVVTSQKDESRERFRGQIERVQKQYQMLKTPTRRGVLAPTGILMRGAQEDGKGTASTEAQWVRRGRGAWCSLQYGAAQQLLNKGLDKRLLASGRLSANLSKVITSQLEMRVLQEANLLLRRVQSMHPSQAAELGWIVRRMRGQEVRDFITDSDGKAGRITLRNGDDIPVAAVLRANAGESDCQESVRAPAPEQPPIYDLEAVVADDGRRSELVETIRLTAMRMRKCARLGKRIAQARDAVQHSEEDKPCNSKAQEIPPKSEHESDSSVKDERATTAAAAHVEAIAPGSWPRLHVFKQHAWSVDLCIALWRLQVWTASATRTETSTAR